MNWQSVYAAYPINARQVWLNNCGITPTGKHIVARMAAHFEQMAQSGPGADAASPARLLLLENEYPSNGYRWEHWSARGVQLGFVPLARTAEAFLENFRRALTPRTRVAALSMVHWCTGLPLPIDSIAAICRERGILLVIDGSQGVGNVPIDFRRVAPAVLCFSAWKWLLGPLGLGALVIDPETLARLRMPFKGTDSVADPQSYLPYQSKLRASVDRYTYSTANYNDWVYFDESLRFLQQLGFEAVQARLLELTQRLWTGLSGLGFQSAYDHGEQPQSGILSVQKPGLDIETLCAGLTTRGIVARVRLEHLRLAPHVYLSPEQMDHSVEEMRHVASL